MTGEEYLDYMNSPLSDNEKETLLNDGWEFANDTYIYIPDDYDGCMASGISGIRKVLLHAQYPEVYNRNRGRCKDILEEVASRMLSPKILPSRSLGFEWKKEGL